MTIDIPIENLAGTLPGIPLTLFVAIAFVMTLNFLRKAAGFAVWVFFLVLIVKYPDTFQEWINRAVAFAERML